MIFWDFSLTPPGVGVLRDGIRCFTVSWSQEEQFIYLQVRTQGVEGLLDGE